MKWETHVNEGVSSNHQETLELVRVKICSLLRSSTRLPTCQILPYLHRAELPYPPPPNLQVSLRPPCNEQSSMTLADFGDIPDYTPSRRQEIQDFMKFFGKFGKIVRLQTARRVGTQLQRILDLPLQVLVPRLEPQPSCTGQVYIPVTSPGSTPTCVCPQARVTTSLYWGGLRPQ